MSMTGNKPPFRPNHLPTLAGRNPVAPPVYRPQPVPRVLQAKPSQMKAPSVYRPQPVPRVLQAKTASPLAVNKRTPPVSSFVRPPVASQLQKPNVKGIVQRKAAPVSAWPAAPRRSMNTPRVLQPYTEAKIPNLGNTEAKVSASEQYILPYNTVLYVRADAAAPRGFVRDKTVRTEQFNYNGARYTAYKHGGSFLKDCLHTAEELINQRQLLVNRATYSRVRGSRLVFGQEEEGKNIECARREQKDGHPVNERANPDVGQAYVIVGTGKPGKYPYHAAAVVAKDGNDTITVEVEAGYTDARDDDRTTEGELHIYEIGGNKSFHADCQKDYDQPITIVIVPK